MLSVLVQLSDTKKSKENSFLLCQVFYDALIETVYVSSLLNAARKLHPCESLYVSGDERVSSSLQLSIITLIPFSYKELLQTR